MKTSLTFLIAAVCASPALAQEPGPRGFTIGPTAGYVKARGADEPSWIGGISARMDINDWLGAEASIGYRRDEFLDGAATVTQVPIQLTAMAYPPIKSLGNIRPYALGGFGWYHFRTDYDSVFGLGDETSTATGLHFGAGVQFPLGGATGFVDFRYVFIDEPGVDNSNLEDENWDTVQFTLGAVFRF